LKSVDSLDDTVNAQQARNFPEHGQTIHIETDSRMTEQLCDVEEISRAAAKIEDTPRTRQIELDLANPSNVDSHPTIEIEIFWPVGAGICHCVTLTNPFETNWIDCLNNSLFTKREATGSEKPERMFPRAGKAAAIYKLSYFMSKSHLKMNHTF